ncbi:MAG: MBL fold metallo-hydrolase [Burkholderiales bacterium]
MRLIHWISCFALAATLLAPAQAQKPPPPVGSGEFRVTLLGTGSPAPVMRRFGPGVLVQAGGQNLLIDSGRGVTQRLMQAGLRLGAVDALFITHLHSDHIVGIPDLWLTGWLEAPFAQRQGPFRVYGPAGTRNLMEGLVKAYDWDLKARVADQGLKPENVRPEVTEFVESVVYEKNGVRVTAFAVDHGELLHPAFGFRIDYDGRSVTISGDTKFSENLIKHATGTDLLIHQVAAARPELLASPVFQVILAHHTKPEEAGVVFTRTRPRLAVYYHFVLLGTIKVLPMTEEDVLAQTRTTYSGPLLIGEDLMAFRIERDRVDRLP